MLDNSSIVKRRSSFHSDLVQLTAKIMDKSVFQNVEYEPRLGDVLQDMGRNKLLFRRLKDNNFAINETHLLSNEARDYLNALQIEKFYTCRLCYHVNEANRCDFHKKYVPLSLLNKKNNDEYYNFLNTEMGSISFIETYYSFLSTQQWKFASVILLRDLTECSSIKELLNSYNYACDDGVDTVDFETMDIEETPE